MGNRASSGQTAAITGVFGILVFITVPIQFALYFMYSGIPPVQIVLWRIFVVLFSILFELIFFTGLQQILKSKHPEYEWLITLMYSAVCISIAVNLVAHSLEAGGVLNPQGIALDATQDGVLAQGSFLMHGSIGRLLMATYLIIIATITLKTKIFPQWTGWLAAVFGALNLLCVPCMFFGTNNSDFYSAAGWGTSAVAAGLFTWWILIISILLLKNRNKYA